MTDVTMVKCACADCVCVVKTEGAVEKDGFPRAAPRAGRARAAFRPNRLIDGAPPRPLGDAKASSRGRAVAPGRTEASPERERSAGSRDPAAGCRAIPAVDRPRFGPNAAPFKGRANLQSESKRSFA
jgi:hypothetical protein